MCLGVRTAMEALLRLFGRGTWKFLPRRSALSSSSLELELSSGRMPWTLAALPARDVGIVRRGKGMGGKVPWRLPCGSVPASDKLG